MFKKLIIFFLFFVLIANKAISSESGGMPQLDPKYWISQIFWLIISFSVLFIVLSKFILPNISSNLENRKSQILDNIETADMQKKESENKLKEFDKIILDTKSQAKTIISDAKNKLINDISKKKEILDKELNQEILEAEKEIIELKKKSPTKIYQIAVDTSSDILKQIIGVEVTKSNIGAMVEDLLKKGKNNNNVI